MILFSCLIASAILVCTYLLPKRLTPARPPAPRKMLIDCAKHDPEPRFWAYFSCGPGVDVFGYPSKGGVYILTSCFGLELDYLGLSRFENTERPSASDPDKTGQGGCAL